MEVGRRVDVNGDKGTIGYIGTIDGYSGQWVGIDWDDDERGKHDGAVNGKRYFFARCKKSASFVRATNVIIGQKIDDEMRKRYSTDSKMDRYKIGDKTIDFIAMEKVHRKQRDIYKLRCVVLDGMLVAFPPASGSLLFDYCTELNLHNNLISKWKDLVEILSFFPSLLYLNLRRNFMEPGMTSLQVLEGKVTSPIFHVVVSECRIDEETARDVLKLFPKLQQLYIASNKLRSFEVFEATSNLQLLDLEDNCIENFYNIVSLSRMQNLVSLNLSNCKLSSIKFGDPVGFLALKDLYLRNNALKGLDWINELAKLPALVKLFLKGHRSLENEFGVNAREIIIAKLPKLVELDRCEISHSERRSAEILFVDKYGVAPVAPEHEKDAERLKLIHGEAETPHSVSKPGISLLKLRFVFGDNEIIRSVPLSMSVQKLYGVVSRLFRLDIRKMTLSAENLVGQISFEFDNPFRSLNFFDLSDDDVIHVHVV